MPRAEPDVSVVMATRDRPGRLRRQLAALRAQTLSRDRYEIIVVDDGSGPATRAVLDCEQAREGPALRVVHRPVPGGPGAARNDGWPLARGRYVAFTDDDCEATSGWLESLLEVAEAAPGSFVQGPVTPLPAEAHRAGVFAHTLCIDGCGPRFETANILYPRELLERLGGFDGEFRRTAEDTDLAWRAIAAGASPQWAERALVHHAVIHLGVLGKLRFAARWDEVVLVYKRHPRLRTHLHGRVFHFLHHQWLAGWLLALVLPDRLWPLQYLLGRNYVRRLASPHRSSLLLAPFLLAHDLLELAGLLRGSVRYRFPVL